MDTRKIIKFGTNSFVVSLPRSFIDKFGLRKGDEVYVKEMEDSINYSPSNFSALQKPREITIHMKNKSLEIIETEIIWAYLVNFDTITVKCENKFDRKKRSRIKEVLQNLAGMEIMEETVCKITARDLININQISIDKTIRRIDIIVRGMIQDSMRCLREDHYESIFDRDEDVNRMAFMTYRIMRGATQNPVLARSLNVTFIDILTYWQIISRLEKIGDQAKRIARFARKAKYPAKMRPRLEAIYKVIFKDYEEVMKVWYMRKHEEALRLANSYKEEVRTLNKLIKDFSPTPDIVNIIENLKSMTSSIKHIARSIIGGG
ncbi:MAG: AbrB/MazE/SpoVT family DNA-binding domain-containing protein [Nanoarchaeota archaeon]|nr:AbrB/MazE/SpoVT family DNA-binding domain-containing protein [Nanoarchaeota archaeon]